MSLLFRNSNEKIDKLAQLAYDRLFELDPKLEKEYNDRQKRSMYQDILSSIEYLDLAMKFNDNKIFTVYAVWLYQLLSHSIKTLEKKRIKDQMIMRYQVLEEVVGDHFSTDEAAQAYHHLDNAIVAIENEFVNFHISSRFEAPEYIHIKREYLSLLLKNDAKGAYHLIERSFDSGVTLDDIYLKVLQEVMYEVGNLWHQNIISVDKEHYCTSTTQIVLSQFYPLIFSQPKNGYKILACAVGTELHEIGIRMVTDLFEYHGWDSVYLGVAVPADAILNAINEHNPHLIALSVTMPQHLSICYELVNTIRKQFPSLKIAVGGRAFQTTDQLWGKWDVDMYTETADQLVEWANRNIPSEGEF